MTMHDPDKPDDAHPLTELAAAGTQLAGVDLDRMLAEREGVEWISDAVARHDLLERRKLAEVVATIREQQPGIEAEIASGQFGSLFSWLRERVHSMGASMGVPQLVQHATGRALSATPFLRYLERKYVQENQAP